MSRLALFVARTALVAARTALVAGGALVASGALIAGVAGGGCARRSADAEAPTEVDAGVLEGALALPVRVTDVHVVQVGGAALHVLARLSPDAWDKLDEAAGGPPTTAATRLLRDDVAQRLLAPATLAQLPVEGTWRKAEGPKYDVQRWVRAPYRSDGAVRIGDRLYAVLVAR